MNDLMTLTTLAAEINLLHDAAEQSAASAVQYAARCGAKLNEAKAQCAHGEFQKWVAENCRVQYRMARKWMKLAEDMPQIIDSKVNYSSLFNSVNSAIAYLSAPDEVKELVEQSPEPVTEKQIKTWEQEYRTAQIERDGYKEQTNYLKNRVDQLVLNYKHAEEEMKQAALEAARKAMEEQAAQAEFEKKQLEEKLRNINTDKLQAERQLAELKEQQKKAVAAGVAAEMAKMEELIKEKEQKVFAVSHRLEEVQSEYDRQRGLLGMVKRRNESLGKIKEAMAAIQIELYDAVDDAYTLNDDEHKAWSAVMQQLEAGAQILRGWLK